MVKWKTVSKLCTIITAIASLFVIMDYCDNKEINIFDFLEDGENEITTDSTLTDSILDSKKEFKFEEVELIYLNSIRENIYSNSNNVVCYQFSNPNDEINVSFTLMGEWFHYLLGNQYKLINDSYNEWLPYNEIFKIRYNWYFIENYSKVRYKIGLKNDKILEKNIIYDLVNDHEFDDYLTQEDDSITWNDEMIRELVSEKAICNKNDEEQVNLVISFVRNHMSPPFSTKKKLDYQEKEINSIDSWKEKEGTSSEYSFIFTSFLRSIGIPAKVEKNNFYPYDYYVKVYIQNKGWLPIDIYDENKNLGDYFNFVGKLKKDIEYKDIYLPEISDYVLFENIIITRPSYGGIDISYNLKNNFGKEIKSFCIKADYIFYSEGSKEVYRKITYLFPGEDLEENGTLHKSLYFEFTEDFDSMKIELSEFDSFCE